MRQGWQILTVDEACQLVNGGTPKSGIAEYWDGDLYWITPAEMGKRLSPYVSTTQRKITELGLQNSSARMLPPHSVILSSRAPIGHLVVNTAPMAFNQGCKGLIPKSCIQYKLLYYYLFSIVEHLDSLGTGATFKELSGGKLKEVSIPVPPLPEQQQIVALLDEAFAGLVTAKANAERNLRSARAIFESHLQHVFSQRGEGWVEKSLKEICAQHLEMHRRVAPRRGDILLAKNGTTGVAAIVDRDTVFDIYVTLAHIRPLSVIRPQLLLHFINSPVAKVQFNQRLKGVGVPNLHLEEIREVRLHFPEDLMAQDRLVAEVDELLEETQRLTRLYERKLAALEELKKSLLHQAFHGDL